MNFSENGASDRSNPGLRREVNMVKQELENALNAFIRLNQRGTDNWNYQRNAGHVIEEWTTWLADREKPVKTFDQLEVSHVH